MSSEPQRLCPCGNAARAQRRKCRTCETRAWRAAHPARAAYDTLRTHARQRGKVFALTLAQFLAFAEQTGYVEGKGIEPHSLSVDRTDPTRGYEPGNLGCLTLADNSAKAWYDRKGIPWTDADERDTAVDETAVPY